jgi:hypothetical protein
MFKIRSGLDMFGPDPLNADPDSGRQINPDTGMAKFLYLHQKSLYVDNRLKNIDTNAICKGKLLGHSFFSVHFIAFESRSGSKFTIRIRIQESLISPDPDRKNYTYLQLRYNIAQDCNCNH